MELAFRYSVQASIDWFPDNRAWKSKSLTRLVMTSTEYRIPLDIQIELFSKLRS